MKRKVADESIEALQEKYNETRAKPSAKEIRAEIKRRLDRLAAESEKGEVADRSDDG